MEKVKKFLKNYYKDIIVLLIVAVSIIGFSRMSGINKATQLIVAMLMIIFSGIIIIVSKENITEFGVKQLVLLRPLNILMHLQKELI